MFTTAFPNPHPLLQPSYLCLYIDHSERGWPRLRSSIRDTPCKGEQAPSQICDPHPLSQPRYLHVNGGLSISPGFFEGRASSLFMLASSVHNPPELSGTSSPPPVVGRPRYHFDRPQSLIKLERALKRLEAPLPEKPNAIAIGPHNDNLSGPDSSSEHDRVLLSCPQRPSLLRHMEGIDEPQSSRIFPLRSLVVFVDARSQEGDDVGWPFKLMLKNMGARVCSWAPPV